MHVERASERALDATGDNAALRQHHGLAAQRLKRRSNLRLRSRDVRPAFRVFGQIRHALRDTLIAGARLELTLSARDRRSDSSPNSGCTARPAMPRAI